MSKKHGKSDVAHAAAADAAAPIRNKKILTLYISAHGMDTNEPIQYKDEKNNVKDISAFQTYKEERVRMIYSQGCPGIVNKMGFKYRNIVLEKTYIHFRNNTDKSTKEILDDLCEEYRTEKCKNMNTAFTTALHTRSSRDDKDAAAAVEDEVYEASCLQSYKMAKPVYDRIYNFTHPIGETLHNIIDFQHGLHVVDCRGFPKKSADEDDMFALPNVEKNNISFNFPIIKNLPAPAAAVVLKKLKDYLVEIDVSILTTALYKNIAMVCMSKGIEVLQPEQISMLEKIIPNIVNKLKHKKTNGPVESISFLDTSNVSTIIEESVTEYVSLLDGMATLEQTQKKVLQDNLYNIIEKTIQDVVEQLLRSYLSEVVPDTTMEDSLKVATALLFTSFEEAIHITEKVANSSLQPIKLKCSSTTPNLISTAAFFGDRVPYSKITFEHNKKMVHDCEFLKKAHDYFTTLMKENKMMTLTLSNILSFCFDNQVDLVNIIDTACRNNIVIDVENPTLETAAFLQQRKVEERKLQLAPDVANLGRIKVIKRKTRKHTSRRTKKHSYQKKRPLYKNCKHT